MCKMKTYDYVNLMTIKETHEPNMTYIIIDSKLAL